MLQQVFHLILCQLVLRLLRLIVRLQQLSLITGLVLFLENLPQIVHDLSLEFGFFVLPLVLLVAKQLQVILIILVIQVGRRGRGERPRQHARLGEAACVAVGRRRSYPLLLAL